MPAETKAMIGRSYSRSTHGKKKGRRINERFSVVSPSPPLCRRQTRKESFFPLPQSPATLNLWRPPLSAPPPWGRERESLPPREKPEERHIAHFPPSPSDFRRLRWKKGRVKKKLFPLLPPSIIPPERCSPQLASFKVLS